MNPGWTLGWNWAKKEVIWSMVGAQTTEQGDCSKFKTNVPHCCKRDPKVVDLLPGVPFNQQYANCCKGGVLAAWAQDPTAYVSAFQVIIGQSGTSNKTVKLPKNFTLLGPGPGYTCGPARIVPSSAFLSADGRRWTRAFSTLTPHTLLNSPPEEVRICSFELDRKISEEVTFECSDMERYLHVLSVHGLEEPEMLCIVVFLLQQEHHSLPNLCLRVPNQKGLHHVSVQIEQFLQYPLLLLGPSLVW